MPSPGRAAWRRIVRLRLLPMLALAVLAATSARAADRYDPRLRFRTISTPRFDIAFHQGNEADAQRLVRIADEVARTLDGTLGPATGRVWIILVSQDDLPNGWATPVPYNLIEIRLPSPSGAIAIGYTDDWLRNVFAHEYTHIVHLSRARGWASVLRRVAGRHPGLFPNLTLPQWQIEGTAVFEESAVTGRGRVPASDFRAIVDVAASAGRFAPIDRAGGGLVDWPSGNAPYVYGAYFNEFLAERYGPDALRRLEDATAGALPYLGTLAYRRVFDSSLGDLWRAYRADAVARVADARAVWPDVRRLTHHGFEVRAPRADPDGRVYYSTTNPDGFPALRRLDPATQATRRVGDRYLGDGVGFSGGWIVFSQAEVSAQVALQYDLYVVRSDGGSSRRLTRGQRAADPDVSPDGRTIACVVQRADRRDLVLLPFDGAGPSVGAPRVLVSDTGHEFDHPRWSSDGATIAVERRAPGALPHVVLVDVHSGAVTPLRGLPDVRSVTPSWRDARTLLLSVDLPGRGFRIVTTDVEGRDVRVLDGTGSPALWPEAIDGGHSLVFVGSTGDGDDLFAIPLDDARWTPFADGTRATLPSSPVAARDAPGATPPTVDGPSAGALPESAYRPGSTLWPRFWTPTIESDADEVVVGAGTWGSDALGRHSYAANAGWTSARGRPDWRVSYRYDRWRPSIVASYSDDTDPIAGGDVRTREALAGAVVPWRSVRTTRTLLGALYASRDDVTCGACEVGGVSIARAGVRAGFALDRTRTYGYSISRESGGLAVVTLEALSEALGSDGDAASVVADVRQYVPFGPPHAVLALRAAGASAWGDTAIRRRFTAGGEASQPVTFGFGTDAIALGRGTGAGVARPHALVVNADWRVPLVRIQRGIGAWPFFARTLHGAVFVDAGRTWDRSFDRAGRRESVGLEVSLDTVVGYVLPLTVASGLAVHDDHDGRGARVAAFARVGRAF